MSNEAAKVSPAVRGIRSAGAVDLMIGRRIRQSREAAGKTLEWTAAQIGVGKTQMGKYELGANRIPTGRLQLLSQLFSLSMAEFFDAEPGTAASQTDDGGLVQGLIQASEVIELLQEFAKIRNARDRRKAIAIIATLAADSST